MINYLAGFLLVGILFAGSCSVHAYDLTKMPKYDVAEANAHYGDLAYMRMVEQMITPELDGMLTTKKEKEALDSSYDLFLYWHAVAMIQLFHGDYDAMQVSIKEAAIGLQSLIDFIVATKGI